MTGEVSPLGDDSGNEASPELRASHQDRDEVVEILRVAAGDGRLSATELDQRVEAALSARTYRELAQLTADLPAVAGHPGAAVPPQVKDLVRIDCKGANARRDGDWVVPRRMEIRAVGGTVKLDFTQAVITQPTLRIEAEVRGGNLILITRPGIEIDADDVAVRGGNVKVRPAPGPKPPVLLRIEVSGEAKGGHIVARPPRRTFWQWLLRQPGRPGGAATA
jgi:Domain of unknown function (DUF1707)